ncbi:hypothetical protein M378DRAFT_156963 [Amanita muscaria Koide BX008]|uniref:Uncharacterized protein n=1 Tax=Amanita muscaria (strain Koide BX008) TaxID=946122 RepID=A0A0C2X5X5_AMAMK|nr:hypothetical protein M378DRAFT_156963 [Amanita muscaria Koide BX008]
MPFILTTNEAIIFPKGLDRTDLLLEARPDGALHVKIFSVKQTTEIQRSYLYLVQYSIGLEAHSLFYSGIRESMSTCQPHAETLRVLLKQLIAVSECDAIFTKRLTGPSYRPDLEERQTIVTSDQYGCHPSSMQSTSTPV